ncbi:MAG: hypothetical protein NC033_06360 [Clostridiales bacterium]|nr:hypothetical protein [Clostridiales bacterium]
MKKDKAHLVAFIGVMFALIFVLFMLEGTLSIVAGVSTCVLSLPVSIALSIYDDWKSSFIGGTLLGVSSCLFCLFFGWLVEANPLVSVLPRFCIGITAYWTYFGFSKLFKKAKHRYFREILPASLAAVVGTLTNTVLYILALSVFVSKDIMGVGTWLLQIAAGIYFPIELVASFVLVPVYVAVMKKVSNKYVVKKKTAAAQEEPAQTNREEAVQVNNDNLS